ncbi:hypothetical protein [Amycolatopsis jejuensis]|uniref:hypothetical protein n=1 Tax=Amycolatopsis jejuensis TaxID=330084 RepID=UPI0005246710|nr:hypothetical protein [Amycolatopsis jejuensis]
MNGLTVTPTQLMAGVGVLLVLFWVWRAGARRAKLAAEKARSGARLISLAGRVLFNAALIVAVQWVVIAHQGGPCLLLAVLGLPALFASYALTRALTVTTVETSKRGGRR